MTYNIIVPLFEIKCSLYIGEVGLESYKKEFAKLTGNYPEPMESCVAGHCNGSIAWCSNTNPYIVMHELKHMADNIAEHLGIKDSNGEFTAYILGHLADKFLDKIDAAKKAKKKKK